jgi:hypothetical protein
MGATPNLGLPWPELPSQADGPAAFQALATATENKMSNYVTRASWIGDVNLPFSPGSQVAVFTQDIPAVAIGWCWLDAQVYIQSGNATQQAGGVMILSGQNLSQELRRLRWHSRGQSSYFSVSGGAAMAVPPSMSVINIQITIACDPTSYPASVYEYNVGVTQFGAPRG